MSLPTFAPLIRCMRLLAMALLVLAAAVLAGCGTPKGNGDANPADIAPKSSPLYAVGTISPEGSQRETVNSVARKLFGENDPGKAISQQVQRSIDRSSVGKLNFEEDVKPWLGKRAAVVVTQLRSGRDGVAGAAIVASKDLAATREAIKKAEQGKRISKSSYRGVEFDTDQSDQSVAGIVDDFLVLGFQPAGFRAVVDASKDGGLVDAPNFQAAKRRGEGKLGLAFFDAAAVLALLPADQRSTLQGVLGGSKPQPVTATLDAKSNDVSFELVAPAGTKASGASQGGQTPVIAGLPGDSFAAFGIPRLGQTLSTTLRSFSSGLGAVLVGPIRSAVIKNTGLDLDRDILAALGDVAFFARGTSLLTVGGGAVTQSPNPAAARRVVSKLGAFVARQGAAQRIKAGATRVGGAEGVKITAPRLPGAINFVVKGAKLVLAYSDPATTEALSPSTKLAQSRSYQRAAGSLGGISPSLFVDFTPIASLVDAASAKRSSSDLTRAKQVLQSLDTLALGQRREGNQQVVRFVLRLK